ncbi:hypothetical protein BDV95DRAFT_651027 [Massariosphaeria phaeospora]|uniref:Uncharacterized protein n=1 Tax=Massariosphaeria phaeospora TaxID=100035 RepID=A0A7C8MC68_9PLEO|nr:hypothetical protein BDV95DRAFT_651027 [Massariosphaeria phaeospora]
MGALGNLVPLVVLFLFVAGAGWVGYQIYLYSNELAERGVRKMEKKNVVFTKDGARVGVKEVRAEDYTDKTQRAFVKTWNAAHDSYVSRVIPWLARKPLLTDMIAVLQHRDPRRTPRNPRRGQSRGVMEEICVGYLHSSADFGYIDFADEARDRLASGDT